MFFPLIPMAFIWRMWPMDCNVVTMVGIFSVKLQYLQIRKCHQSLCGRSGEKKIIKISYLHTFALRARLDLSRVVAASTCIPSTSQAHEFKAEFKGKIFAFKANCTFIVSHLYMIFSLWKIEAKPRVCNKCVRVRTSRDFSFFVSQDVLPNAMHLPREPFNSDCNSSILKTRQIPMKEKKNIANDFAECTAATYKQRTLVTALWALLALWFFSRGSSSSNIRYGPSLSPSAVSHKFHVLEAYLKNSNRGTQRD